ncbi:glycosyltransferase family 2 protein [Halothiobacillus sp. DCM-1]|uniref:glycosyltransferase family 2 protein n=1 Tax=Halothiobacillus sp. DCM-1 TaxID=3112558 RepID=UPI0032548BB4
MSDSTGAVRISCIVPAFNEAENLPALLAALKAQLDALTTQWEIVLVDDGSRDATRQVLAAYADWPGLVVLHLSRNFGKEAALSAGLDFARGEAVFLLDADLQHPVAMMPVMLDAWRAGAQMVYLVRANRDDEPWWKRVGSLTLYRLINYGAVVQVPADASDFRLLDAKVVAALRQLPERNRFMKGLYAWVGFRTQALPYTPDPRLHGQSSFSGRRLLGLALTGLTAFSNMPLRLWSVFGSVLALISLGYGAYVTLAYFLEQRPVAGWTTIVAGMMLFGGIQLISIGILGEYLGRVYDEVKQRPRYLLDEVQDNSPFQPDRPDAPRAETQGDRV